jgi:hypothetical protein
MANRKISDLTALTAPASGDLLPIVDISEAAAADKNKKITYGELLTSAPLGSAAAPSIAFEGDINTGIYSPGADQIGIATGGTSRIVVDASGNVNIDSSTLYVDAVNNRVGIGTTGPGGTLDIKAAASTAPLIVQGPSSEFARIDSSGRLLVGTSSSTVHIRSGQKITSVATGGDYSGINSTTYAGASVDPAPIIDLAKSRGSTDSSMTSVISGDVLGYLQFRGADGTNFVTAAEIKAAVDGTPGANDMPGRLVFSTTLDGPGNIPTERMRIGNAGDIFFATTSLDPATGCTMRSSAAGTFWINGTSDVTTWAQWTFKNGNGTVGSITTNGSATAYNTSSDYRLKENITLLDGAIDRLNQLPVHRFNFIADPDTVVDGFIAHEAAAVVPECVTGTKDEEDEDGNPVYQGIDQSKLVPLLTAALQEAIAKIESLETRLSALEGA